MEPDSAEEWHVRQTGHTIQREAKAGWLASDDALFGHAFLEHARRAVLAYWSSDVTETIELVAAPNWRRQHATG
jgi:hypothetical protein